MQNLITLQDLESALESVANQFADEVVSCLRPVLQANLKNGRIATFTENSPARLQEYVLRVAAIYTRLHGYLEKIQTEKDDLVWEPLLKKLSVWAYNIFLSKNFDPIYTREEIVPALANEAAIQLLRARFPYDTEFDPWAFMIVKGTCLKFMRSSMKKSIVPAHSIVELDESSESWVDDPTTRPDDVRREIRASLLAAIDQLPPVRREIIIQKYFYELPSEKIAENTQRSVAAVYSLHFNAIENLRKILSD